MAPRAPTRCALCDAGGAALIARGVKLLVVACNTASACAARARSDALAPMPVIGVIEPGAKAAVAAAPTGRHRHHRHRRHGERRRLSQRHPRRAVERSDRPASLPAVRAADRRRPDRRARSSRLSSHRYLDPLFATVPKPKCLLLGCTHFPVLKPMIARIAGRGRRAGRQRGNDRRCGRGSARRARAREQRRGARLLQLPRHRCAGPLRARRRDLSSASRSIRERSNWSTFSSLHAETRGRSISQTIVMPGSSGQSIIVETGSPA